MNNKGFIATSLIYSFFLIFVTLFLTIVADYLQDKVLLNTIENGIKTDLNNELAINDIPLGSVVYLYEHDSCGATIKPFTVKEIQTPCKAEGKSDFDCIIGISDGESDAKEKFFYDRNEEKNPFRKCTGLTPPPGSSILYLEEMS